MKEVNIPRYIDSQPQFLWWEFDELIMVVLLFTLGIMTDTLTLMLLVVIPTTTWALKRFKNNSLEGIFYHMMFWVGVLPLNKEFKDALKQEDFN